MAQKKKRVHCDECINFVSAMTENEDMFSKIIKNAQCKLGKRVMFRKPKSRMDSSDFGYVRYCDKYVLKHI